MLPVWLQLLVCLLRTALPDATGDPPTDISTLSFRGKESNHVHSNSTIVMSPKISRSWLSFVDSVMRTGLGHSFKHSCILTVLPMCIDQRGWNFPSKGELPPRRVCSLGEDVWSDAAPNLHYSKSDWKVLQASRTGHELARFVLQSD